MKRITPVRYLWEAPDWPRLRYDAEALLGPLGLVRRRQGELWAILSPDWIDRASALAPNGVDFARLAAELQDFAAPSTRQ